MEKEIIMLEDQFPNSAKGVAEFSTPLAHQIIAGTVELTQIACLTFHLTLHCVGRVTSLYLQCNLVCLRCPLPCGINMTA